MKSQLQILLLSSITPILVLLHTIISTRNTRRDSLSQKEIDNKRNERLDANTQYENLLKQKIMLESQVNVMQERIDTLESRDDTKDAEIRRLNQALFVEQMKVLRLENKPPDVRENEPLRIESKNDAVEQIIHIGGEFS